MKWTSTLLALLLMVGIAAGVFHLLQRQLAATSLAFGFHPDVSSQLWQSLEDQKRLADLDPEREPEYRARFEALETTVQRLQILERSRTGLIRRYNTITLVLFAGVVVVIAAGYAVRQARHARRLSNLQQALTQLAAGSAEVQVADRKRDTIGRIAAMIEDTSRRIAGDRKRLAALDNLSAWQEATRRQAHEMRTPLTALKLELTRLSDGIEAGDPAELRRLTQGAMGEVERLRRFSEHFTSFARLPAPRLKRTDLAELLREFIASYADAWPNLRLSLHVESDAEADVDREMLRQVWVNLGDNSAAALGAATGTLRFEVRSEGQLAVIDVVDDGPGVDASVRDRLFEPYVTTSSIGEGMGLGLAISKKILLDHGGDLELIETSPAGSTFRMTL